MADSFFLESLWTNQPLPHKELIGRTTLGPCAAAGKLAQRLLSAEEADEMEHALAQRRATAVKSKRLQTFDKELSYLAAQFATPVLLCIVGGGRILRSCALVDHTGRREILLKEAKLAYLTGVIIVGVDAEETLTVTVRTKDETCPKLRLHAPLAAPAAAPAPASDSVEQLLERHKRALVALGW